MLTEAVLSTTLLFGLRAQGSVREDRGTSYIPGLDRITTGRTLSDDWDEILSSKIAATGRALVSRGVEDVVSESAVTARTLAFLPGDSKADDAIDELMARLGAVEATPLPLVD